MTVDSYDDKCPRWLRNGQVPPAALWAEHFNRNAKKRNVIYTKYLEQRLAACRAKYGFLNPEQVFGMALAELRVPTCGFKINQKFLNSHKANRRQSKGDSKGNEKSRSYCLFEDSEPSLEEVTVDKWSFPSSNKKNRRQSKGNSKPGNKNSRSYCLFEDAEPSSDEISTNDFHHRNQIYEFPSSPTRFVQNDDIFGDLSEMFEEVQIQPFKSLTRKTRPSDVSSSTKRKNIKSPKDNQLLNQFEKFKEMVNCDGEITSHETRNESAKKSSVILPVPVVNAVAKNFNKSILKNNKSKGSVSKTSIHEKSVQFNENLEEVREYLAFEDNDDSSTIEYNSPLDSSLNISFQEASKTMSESSLLDESSITNVEEIVASTPLPVEEESVMENVEIEENEIVENGSTYTSPTIQSIENKDIEEGTTCGSPLFETSQTEDCETVSQKSESSDGSIIYNSFVDSYKCTIPLKNKSNEKLLNESREAISIENNISSMKSNTICYEQDMQDIEHSSPIQVICEKEVQESHLSDDSDYENYSLNNSVQSDSDEGIEATNVIFNYVEMNEEDRRDIKLRQKYATSQNSDTSDSIAVNLEVNIDVDSEAEKIVDSEAENVADSVAETESQNEDTPIRSEKIDSSELNITNQNNLANNIDESIENYESYEDSSSSSKSELRDENGEVETPKVTLQINKQNSCVDGLKQYTNSQYSNKSPETGIIASSRMEMVSKQNEELPMVQKFANIDLDILNQNNLSETIGDTEINRSMIASTRAISLEDVAKDQQYDKFESVSQSENELFRKKRLHFVSVSVPICPADVIGDVELPQNEQFEMTSKDNQRTDLGTTYRNNLSKIHKDTEMNMRALTPTTAHSNEEYVTGDQNKNVESLCLLENEIKRKERSYFESLKVPIRPTDETEDFSTMERLSEEIGGDNIIDYKSQSDSNSLDNITVEKKISKNYESTKISIAPKLIESSNLNQESNVLYLQSKTLPFELNKQIKSKQPSHLQSPTIVIHPKKRVNSDSKIRSPKESIHLTKGQISHLESNRIPFLNRNEDKNSSEGHISSQLLDMETQTLNDLNSNSSSDSSVQLVSAASNKSAKKRNFSSIFGNSLGKYLPGMYPGNAVSPSSIDERPCTNYDLSLDEIINIEDDDKESYLKLNDSFFDEKSSPFHKIPSFEDDFQLIQSDDSLAEFCAALRKPKDWRSKLYSQLKSDDESLASSLEFADPKRRRRNADSKKYLEPTTKENIMTSQTTNVTETTSIAEMRKLICTDWLAHNEFFKTNTDNWLTTSNTPITDFNIRIPDDTTRVIPMDDGGEEDSHQLPDIEFLSSEY